MTGTADPTSVRLGVSSCLLGEEVRYDGRHKRQPFLTEVLGPRVEWVPVCPEVDIGLGVPREPIHLVTGPGELRLVGVDSGRDHTTAMRTYAEDRVDVLERTGIDGYVLKSRSPSCGLDVPVQGLTGGVGGTDRGRFAAVLIERMPDLPVVQEDGLRAPTVRDSFLERVCARNRWRRRGAGILEGLEDLHLRHELQVEAHAPGAHAELGALVEEVGGDARERAVDRYRRLLHEILAVPPTRARHTQVMHRILRRTDGGRDLEVLVDRYADGEATWSEVATALRRRTSGTPRLTNQTYLQPLGEVGSEPVSW